MTKLVTLLNYYVSILLAAAAAWDQAVCLSECVYGNCAETENDNCHEDVADDVESLLPDLVAKTDCLECAPETVSEVDALKVPLYRPAPSLDVPQSEDPCLYPAHG